MTPSEAERDAFAELAALLLSPTFERAAADDKARLLGFGLEEVPEIPGTVLLRERPTRRRGGGAYLIRLHAKSATIIQAPHTFFDEGTLPLACEMFQRSAAAALFIDTAHRYKAAPPDEDGGYPADVAHARDSFFQAATAGALNANSERTVVQLHGFVPRESGAAVVLSSGLAQPDAPLPTRVRDRLQTLLPELVARFPDETQELGATGNAQGVLVRNAGGQFLHVEMSASLRRVLLAQPDLRARFLDSLAACLEHP